MGRARLIYPSFATDADLYDAELRAALPLRLAFPPLWCLADREGRFEWKPRELKLGCLPFDDVDFGAVLEALASGGFIVRYEAEGKVCGYIPNFHKYQKPHPRETPSRLPAPPEGAPKANLGRAEGEPRGESKSILPSVSVAVPDSDPVAVGASQPLPWADRMAALWSAGIGVTSPSEMTRHLQAAVDLHGEGPVEDALKVYIEDAPVLEKGPQWLKPRSFAEQVSQWIRRSQPIEVYTETGEMSPEYARFRGIKP